MRLSCYKSSQCSIVPGHEWTLVKASSRTIIRFKTTGSDFHWTSKPQATPSALNFNLRRHPTFWTFIYKWVRLLPQLISSAPSSQLFLSSHSSSGFMHCPLGQRKSLLGQSQSSSSESSMQLPSPSHLSRTSMHCLLSHWNSLLLHCNPGNNERILLGFCLQFAYNFHTHCDIDRTS